MITETDLKLAERLRGIRLSKDIKQEFAFTMIGLTSQQEYSKLENGKIHFDDDLIKKVCKGFNISPEDFLGGANKTYITNSPNSNSLNYSTNSTLNDISLINKLISSKEETIASLREIITIKDELINALKNK